MKIAVIGSLNMDLVSYCKRVPDVGETLFGEKFVQNPGGKGANQAVAIAKQGENISFFGKVGNDSFGKELKNSLKKVGVKVENIEEESISTGIAKILVEATGNNRILVIPGANFLVDKEYIDRKKNEILKADIIVLQFEIPLETVEYIVEVCKEKTIILNPAPAKKIPDSILKNIDYLIPNESELGILAQMKSDNIENIKKAYEKIEEKGVKNLITTLGDKGVLYKKNGKLEEIPSYKVKAIDTTAAGDSFIGGFVSGLSRGESLEAAIDRGMKTASIAVTREGAQKAIPTKEEVENFKGVKNEKN